MDRKQQGHGDDDKNALGIGDIIRRIGLLVGFLAVFRSAIVLVLAHRSYTLSIDARECT